MNKFKRLQKLAQLIAKEKNSKAIFQFFPDLFTEAEMKEMEARLHIVECLAENKTQRETAKEVGCSVSIVSRGAKQLRNSQGGFKKYTETLKTQIKKETPTQQSTVGTDEFFELWDLKVEVIDNGKRVWSGQKNGDYLEVKGEHIFLPAGQGFSLYALSAILPLLPAKQRITHPNDWMSTDTDICGPDPHCNLIYRIWRTQKSTFQHSQTTQVPLNFKKNDTCIPTSKSSP